MPTFHTYVILFPFNKPQGLKRACHVCVTEEENRFCGLANFLLIFVL